VADADLIFDGAPASGPPWELVFGGPAAGAPAGPIDVRELVFADPPASGPPWTLVFGSSDAVTQPPTDLDYMLAGSFAPLTLSAQARNRDHFALAGAFAPLTAAVQARNVSPYAVAGSFAALSLTATAAYDNRLTRYLAVTASAPQQPAASPRPSHSSGWGTSVPQRGGQDQPWQLAITGRIDPDLAHNQGSRLHPDYAAPWSPADPRSISQTASNQPADTHRISRVAAYQWAAHIRREVMQRLQTGQVRSHPHTSGKWALANPLRFERTTWAGASRYRVGRQADVMPWQRAQIPHTGREAIVVVPPGVDGCYTPSGELLFSFPWDGSADIVFQCGNYVTPSVPSTLYILPARVYMTAHTIFAQRVPDNLDVPIFDATVAADSGSYCWSLTASGPASLFELLAPTGGLPAQLRVTLDGLPFLFAVDSMARTHQFGQTGVRIQGRSVTALVAAPYLRATVRNNASGAMLAQQLAAATLDLSGVALDWGVGSGALANGGLIDWLVPAGAWSHQGTPLEAVQAIAQAAGGYLQSARNAATLMTRHFYGQRQGDNPGAPWGWMTGPADIELAPDALITESVTRKDGPDINGVYVSGTTQGVLALVKRIGSAGDKLAAMATDPLITHVDAARQRGLSILGAAGSKYDVAIELPVLTGVGQPGILDVGQLVQINAAQPWRGRVRAVNVSAKSPSLRQTVTLERHLEIA
jgi:hypothetical protein